MSSRIHNICQRLFDGHEITFEEKMLIVLCVHSFDEDQIVSSSHAIWERLVTEEMVHEEPRSDTE